MPNSNFNNFSELILIHKNELKRMYVYVNRFLDELKLNSKNAMQEMAFVEDGLSGDTNDVGNSSSALELGIKKFNSGISNISLEFTNELDKVLFYFSQLKKHAQTKEELSRIQIVEKEIGRIEMLLRKLKEKLTGVKQSISILPNFNPTLKEEKAQFVGKISTSIKVVQEGIEGCQAK